MKDIAQLTWNSHGQYRYNLPSEEISLGCVVCVSTLTLKIGGNTQSTDGVERLLEFHHYVNILKIITYNRCKKCQNWHSNVCISSMLSMFRNPYVWLPLLSLSLSFTVILMSLYKCLMWEFSIFPKSYSLPGLRMEHH